MAIVQRAIRGPPYRVAICWTLGKAAPNTAANHGLMDADDKNS